MQQQPELTAGGTMIDRYLPEARPGATTYGAANSVFDASSIRAMLWRQRYILIVVTILSLLAATALWMLARPIFVASSTLQVQVEAPSLVEGEELLQPIISSQETPRYLETIGSVLRSRTMAQRVVEMLELERDPRLFGDTPIPADEQTARAVATTIVASGIEVVVPYNNRILTLNYRSPDPVLAAELANAYADAYIAEDISQGVEANSFARQFLEQQIQEVSVQLQEAEVQANGYARSNRLVNQQASAPSTAYSSSSSGGASSLTYSTMNQINEDLAQARANRIMAEQRWRAVATLPPGQLPEVQQSASVQSMLSQRAEITTRLADLNQRYREDYPGVREAQAQLATLDEQIAAQGREVKNTLRDAYEIARRQEAALTTELERVSGTALDEQDRRIAFNSMDRDVSALRQQLEGLLARYNAVSTAANLRSSSVLKLDDAMVPSVPESPNLWKNLIVGLVLGLGLAVVLSILREALDGRMRNQEEMERKLRLRALGQTPNSNRDVALELHEPFSALSEAYSSLRASIDFAMGLRRQFVLQVTSTQPREGKSTSSIALAEKYGAIDRKVLLVDMDLRRPSIGKTLLDKRVEFGVTDVLFGRVTLDQAVVRQPKFDLLAVRDVPEDPSEILSSGLVGEFIARARGKYDVIIIDSSPVMGIADAPLLSRFVDGVIFVVEANRASSLQASAALRRLSEINANVVGAIMTKYRALNAGDPFEYQYKYYSYNSTND